jgi:hypothetical protein
MHSLYITNAYFFYYYYRRARVNSSRIATRVLVFVTSFYPHPNSSFFLSLVLFMHLFIHFFFFFWFLFFLRTRNTSDKRNASTNRTRGHSRQETRMNNRFTGTLRKRSNISRVTRTVFCPMALLLLLLLFLLLLNILKNYRARAVSILYLYLSTYTSYYTAPDRTDIMLLLLLLLLLLVLLLLCWMHAVYIIRRIRFGFENNTVIFSSAFIRSTKFKIPFVFIYCIITFCWIVFIIAEQWHAID